MIARWTLKSLVRERGSLCASVGGVAASLLVVMLLEGMFAGEADRIVAYVERAGADVWVMQAGVSNMHMASSLMRRELARRVESLPGVAATTPILYVSTFLTMRDYQFYSYVVGLQADALRGGPWAMVAGVDRPGPGEAVIPDVLARKGGLELGDQVAMLNRTFRVVGVSSETYSMANSITFVSYADLADLLSAPEAASYLLVEAGPAVSATALAERIRSAIPEVNALTRDALAERDTRLAMEMGVDIIRVMTWVGSLLAGLIVTFTVYSATLRRSRELGVAKALGLRTAALWRALLLQATALCALGYATAVSLAYGLRPIVEWLVPEVALRFPPGFVVRLAVAAVVVAAGAALGPGWRISRLDPAAVFRA